MNTKTTLSLLYQRIFFLRTSVDRLLSAAMAFSCLLVLFRVVHTHRLTFVFLIWNLLLAYLPWLMTSLAGSRLRMAGGKLVFYLLFGCWLAFIPNSFYILTDLYHLGDSYNDFLVPDWFDLVMILSFAWNGLLLGILSVRQMEKLMRARFQKMPALLFLIPIMWLNALGVYVGRYMRYNSWDLLTDPFALIRGIAGILIHPFSDRYAWGMITCFSILLTLIYLTLKKISHAIR